MATQPPFPLKLVEREAVALERIAVAFEMMALACDRDSVQDEALKEKLTRATTAARKRVAQNLKQALRGSRP